MLILVGVIMIYPLVWMVGATFKSNAEIFAGIGFLTANPTLQGYIDAVTQNYGGDISIWRAFINTYSFVIPKVIFTVISSVIAAYGFSRFKFKGRDMLFGIMISTLFLPQVVLNVPQYLMYNSFGWINSPFYLPLWVPSLFATETYFVYQLVQFMRSIPHDLDEAAAIDGCGPVKILYKIIAPMLSPSLVACGLFQFMWSCNDYMGPLLYVQTPQQVPDVHLRQAVHGRRQRFQLEPYPGTVPDLHHPAVGRFLLRTGCLHRRHFRRRREGLNAALAVQNLL